MASLPTRITRSGATRPICSGSTSGRCGSCVTGASSRAHAANTYGTHSIWAFWDNGVKAADQRTPCPEAVKLPGSTQVGYARRLIESRPQLTRVPDQSLITSENPDGPTHCQAIRNEDGAFAMIYSASGAPFSIDLAKLSGTKLRAWWWDPRTGKSQPAGDLENTRKEQAFTPPSSGDGKDWVLVLDDATKGWPAPGERKF